MNNRLTPMPDEISRALHPDAAKIRRSPASLAGGRVLWLTGLSGSGKSTLAGGLRRSLVAQRIQAVVLDGDQLRTGLNSDLGFSAKDRTENVRRTAEVACLFSQAGFVVIASLISPLVAHRDAARRIVGDQFFEIYVDARLEVCEARDPKGFYARARRGEISEFTGVGSPYEKPVAPDLAIDTERLTPEQSIEILHHFALASLRLSNA